MEQVLQLTSFGARLRVKDGLLEVTVPDMSGAGDHSIQTFAAHQVQTILLHRHTSISADALLLAREHEVDIYIIGQFDMPEAFVASLTAPPSILLWQQQLSLIGTPFALSAARYWLATKIERKIEWLSKIRGYRDKTDIKLIDDSLSYLRDLFVRFQQFKINSKTDVTSNAAILRGMEGAGSRLYLETLSRLAPEVTSFEKRSRQPALDLFNAALNYAYGILYRWVEKAIWETGLNPYIGCFHSMDRKQKSLLFDLIEPFRPWADRVVFTLFSRKEMNGNHGEPHQGGIWLNREGKKMITDALYKRFNQETHSFQGKKWSLRQSIGLETRIFAAAIRKFCSVGVLPEWQLIADPI